MIKATLGDGKLIMLGLSHQNLDRLRQGQPIKINGRELGIAPDIVIFAGETEQTMTDELAELVGPDTQVEIDPRFRS